MKARKALLLAGASLACFVLLEIALRVHAEWRSTGVLEDAYRNARNPPRGASATLGDVVRPSPDPQIIYELKPNLDVVFKGQPLRTNGRGWREEEIRDDKPPGVIRIVGIGDSYMFGSGVRVEDRYMDRLEAGLNASFPAGRWQTVALAAPGYDLAQELAVLRRYGLAYHPDLIIYGYVGNDHCLPNFVLPREPFLSLESFVARYARNAWSRVTGGPGGGAEDVELRPRCGDKRAFDICRPEDAPPRYRGHVGQANLVEHSLELARLAQDLRVPLVIFAPLQDARKKKYFDLAREKTKDYDKIYVYEFLDEFAAYLKAGGYADYRHSPLAISERDNHPSPAGHDLIASLLLKRFEASGIASRLVGVDQN
jgi:hypothetical protein